MTGQIRALDNYIISVQFSVYEKDFYFFNEIKNGISDCACLVKYSLTIMDRIQTLHKLFLISHIKDKYMK